MNICRRYSGRVARPIGTFEEKVSVDLTDGKKKVKSFKIVKSFKKNESNNVIELPVDQFSGMPFMQNSNGFISNDIMVFEECQSDSVARAVLSRLKQIHPLNVDQNMTLDQMMASAVPANYGSPAEFVSAHKMVAEKMYKMHKEQADIYAQQMAAQAAQAAQEEVNALNGSVPNPE